MSSGSRTIIELSRSYGTGIKWVSIIYATSWMETVGLKDNWIWKSGEFAYCGAHGPVMLCTMRWQDDRNKFGNTEIGSQCMLEYSERAHPETHGLRMGWSECGLTKRYFRNADLCPNPLFRAVVAR